MRERLAGGEGDRGGADARRAVGGALDDGAQVELDRRVDAVGEELAGAEDVRLGLRVEAQGWAVPAVDHLAGGLVGSR